MRIKTNNVRITKVFNKIHNFPDLIQIFDIVHILPDKITTCSPKRRDATDDRYKKRDDIRESEVHISNLDVFKVRNTQICPQGYALRTKGYISFPYFLRSGNSQNYIVFYKIYLDE